MPLILNPFRRILNYDRDLKVISIYFDREYFHASGVVFDELILLPPSYTAF